MFHEKKWKKKKNKTKMKENKTVSTKIQNVD